MKGLGGQPGMLTIGLFLTSESTPTAPVGLTPEDETPPNDAQEPMAITAAAWFATSRRTSVPFLPPSFRKSPLLFVGIEPSTTRTYLPSFCVMASRRAS